MVDVCLLGTSGMEPLTRRRLTSCIIRIEGVEILIDAGEGTQLAIKECGLPFRSIKTICLTHYHADHVAGLPGVLLAISNSGRTEPVTIMGPPGLKRIYSGLTTFVYSLKFDVNLVEITDGFAYQDGNYTINAFAVQHTLPCFGYNMTLTRPGKFLVAEAERYNVPKEYWSDLVQGKTIKDGNRILVPSMVIGPPRKGIKVTYCTDSRPCNSIIKGAEGSDLFICEGMYNDDNMIGKAKETRHMLYSEAAQLAKEAGVRELWLTHFSPSIVDPQCGSGEVHRIFSNAKVGKDGLKTELVFED